MSAEVRVRFHVGCSEHAQDELIYFEGDLICSHPGCELRVTPEQARGAIGRDVREAMRGQPSRLHRRRR